MAPIVTPNQWNEWLNGRGRTNPVSIRFANNYPDIRYSSEYYPAFGLAVRYLLDKKGLGKSYEDVKVMLKDIPVSKSFEKSFKKYMGISVAYFKEQFNELITEYLNKTVGKNMDK